MSKVYGATCMGFRVEGLGESFSSVRSRTKGFVRGPWSCAMPGVLACWPLHPRVRFESV